MQHISGIKTSRLLFGGVAALIFVALLIWHLGSTAQSAPASSQGSVTLAISALIGTIFTGSISFAGLVLKDAVDRRSAMLQVESEKRLRMDTALKAVEIISKAEVDGAPIQESREAALLVISSLNQPLLALTLADQFLRQKKVSAATFVAIADGCLMSGENQIIIAAADALEMHASELCTTTEIDIPPTLSTEWRRDFPAIARYSLVHAFVKAVTSKPYRTLDVSVIASFMYLLHKVVESEPDAHLRSSAARFLVEFCDSLQYSGDDAFMAYGREVVIYSHMREAADLIVKAAGERMTDTEGSLVNVIRQWKLDKQEKITQPDAQG